MGAGLLVLSKYPITDTLFMSYAPNGLPVKIHQADFYGGKGVGLCRIDADGHFLDVYTTHVRYVRVEQVISPQKTAVALWSRPGLEPNYLVLMNSVCS